GNGSQQAGGQTAGPAANGYYHFSYPQGQQTRPPQPQQTRPPQAPPFQAAKAQRQAAANRAAAARQAARQQAEAARQAVKAPKGAAPQVPMKMVSKGSPAKYYITAVVA